VEVQGSRVDRGAVSGTEKQSRSGAVPGSRVGGSSGDSNGRREGDDDAPMMVQRQVSAA
jgi:hypothetical protein